MSLKPHSLSPLDIVSCGVRNKIKEQHLSLSSKTVTRLIALTPEIDCNQTAMGLPPVTSAVYLIAN
jgi:hypothetical protein